jgi:hypothetical protein
VKIALSYGSLNLHKIFQNALSYSDYSHNVNEPLARKIAITVPDDETNVDNMSQHLHIFATNAWAYPIKLFTVVMNLKV